MLDGIRFPLRFLVPATLLGLIWLWSGAVVRGQDSAVGQAPAAEAANSKPAETPPAEPPAPEPAPAETPPPKAASAEPSPSDAPPAEAMPADLPAPEAVPAEAEPAEAATAGPNFEQLADPKTAELLKLTADQRERIAELLAERKEKLAAVSEPSAEAAEEKRRAIREASDKELAEVLTQVQYGDFIGKPVEKRLQFRFKFQQWEDVLELFAEQAELSLVVPEAPPPGTFNYTDTREYTPTEAIDLMNSVLIHQGYTLVRRGRMLMVINLESGIPEGVVPQVDLEELHKRGKHELVTVEFPIGRRPADSTTEAIRPFLTPYGKVLPVAATQKLMVTDMAGIMPTIHSIIEAISEPPPPEPQPTPSKPESPELRVYSIKVADPQTAVSVLSQLISPAPVVLDPSTKRINVNATPSQHAVVEKVLEKMEEELPPEKQRVLEVYPIDEFLQADTARRYYRRRSYVANGSGEQLLSTLQKIVADAELSINQQAGTLVVWATPADQETIKSALEKLSVERAPEETPQLQTYRLTKVDPDATLTLLQTILPDARLTVDPQTRTLIALTVPSEQAVISNTLKTLQPEEPGPDTPELRFYELALAMPPSLLDVIQKVAPRATVAMDSSGERLMAVASPAEHAKIEKTIEHMKKTTFIQGRGNLKIYPVTPAQRKRFEVVMESLSTQLPGIKVITDAVPGELAVWAKPQQHEALQEILDELKAELPEEEKYQLVGYPITSADATSVLTMLQELFPNTKLVLDPKGRRLLAWTSLEEHASIKASLEQIQAAGSPEEQPRFEVYEIQRAAADGPALVSQLQTLVPGITVTADTQRNKLIAYGTPKQHELLKAALASLQPEGKPTVEVYPLIQADPTATLSLLSTLVPDAQLTLTVKGDTLIARATSADHQTITATLEKLQPAEPGPNTPQLQFYTFVKEPPGNLVTLLEKLTPKAEITVDAEKKRLIVFAPPSDHATIQTTIDKFKEATPESELQVVVYSIRSADSSSLISLLETLVPDAQLSLEAQTGNLVALALADEHQIIKETLDQLQPETPGPNTPVLRFHPTQKEPSAELLAMLQKLAPKAQITLDSENRRVMAVATAADHETIETAIAEYEASAADRPELRFHPFVQKPPADLLAVLQKLVPNAQITLDSENDRLMVVATPAEHEIVKATVEEFEATTPLEEPSKLVVYALTPRERKRFELLQPTLSEQLPGMKVIGEAEPGELAIWAKPTEHLLLAEVMEQLKSDVPEKEKRRLVGYPIRTADPDSVLQMLQTLYPETEFVLDLKANRLLVWTHPLEHDSIKASLEEIEAAGVPEERPKFEAFPVYASDVSTIVTTLQPLVPNAKLTADTRTKRLIAWGTPTELEIIRRAVASLKQAETIDTIPRLEVYYLKKGDPQTTLTLLQGLLPDVQFTLDPQAMRLMAYAVASDHEMIKSTLERIEAEGPPEDRPRFETYPIYGADTPDAVSTFISSLQPLVPQAKLTIDAKGRTLLAWATPDEQDIIRKAVESLRGGAAENLPRLEVYRLTKADPNSVLALLEKLLPEARLSIDTQTNSLVALAVPADQQTIQSTVQKIEAEGPAEDQPRFDTYPIYGVDTPAAANTFILALQPLVPKAKLTIDAKGRKLVVWGTAQEHEIVAKAVASMGRGGTAEGALELKVYRLTKADPNSLVALLQNLLPDAQLSIDSQTNSLVALASGADQAAIKATLEQLQPEKPGPNTPVLRFHPVTRKPADNLLAALQPLVPKAQLTLDTENDRVMAVATPADHEVIQSTIQEFEASTPPDEPNKLVVYSVTPSGRKRFEALLGTLTEDLPGVEIISGGEPGSLAIWAKPTEHLVIAEILKELEGAAPKDQQFRLGVYPIKSVDPQSVLTVLERLFPETEFVVDEKTRRLMVWTSPSEHEKIKSAIAEMDTGVAAEFEEQLRVYPVPDVDPSVAIQMLQELLPEIKFTTDTTAGTILAWAREADHKTIAQTLEQMSAQGPPEMAPSAAVYRLEAITPTNAMQVLQLAVPKARLTAGPGSDQLVAWASPKDHQLIKSTLEAVDVESPHAQNAKAVIYTLEGMSPGLTSYAMSFLSTAVPEARFAPGAQEGQLVAWATPKVHEKIAELVDQLTAEAPEKAHKIVVYNLQATSATSAMQVLSTAVPQAKVTLDTNAPQKLTVWARPTEHETIASILQEIDVEGAAETAFRVKVYTVEGMTGTAAYTILRSQVPQAQVSYGTDPQQLVVWARAADHQRIGQLLDEIAAAATEGEAARVAQVYTLESLTATAAMTFLQQVVPQAQLSPGAQPDQLMVWARPQDQQKIQGTLAEIDVEGPADKAARAVLYPLEGMDTRRAVYALRFLRDAVPGANMTISADGSQLIAFATPKDHQVLEGLVKQLVEESPELARTAVAYDLKYATASDAIEALEPAVADASLSVGADENQVVAWARPRDHEKIRQILKELDRQPPPETEPTAEVYSLEAADASEAMRVLREAVPQARLSIGAEPHQLIAWARPADHQIIQQIIDKMVEQGPDELAAKVVVYTLQTTDADSAIRFLRTAVPEAELSIGTDPRRLIAWARPRDHEVIQRAVEAMSKEEPPETAPRVVVYTLKTTDATKALEILEQAVPDAQFTVGADTRQLIAWARPADHQVIAEAVEKMSQEEPAETRPRVVVYDLESTGAAAAIELLEAAVPEAKLGVGSDPGKLIAWARPEDHEVIRSAVEQFEADSWLEGNRIISVYPIKAGDAKSLIDVLSPQLKDHAQFVVDSQRNSLIVWADAKHHEAINRTIEQFIEGLEGTQEMTSQVYRFQLADPTAALSVLQTLVPSARLALDQNTQSIVVSALPEDHAKIQATIDEMEREDVKGQRPVLRMHRVTSGNVDNIYSSLYTLFRQDPTVQLTLDSPNDSIIAVASPLKHEKIEELIREVEKGVLLDSANTLQLYSMKNIDTTSAMEILDRLLEKRGAKADLSFDSQSNQLVAIARPDHHLLIRDTLEQLRREEPGLEIYDLEYVDPFSAEMAIGSEFEDEGFYSAPQVDIDPVTQQLFIRASEEQHQRIRQLLIKMGETKLQLLGRRGTEAMRVIRFHGDLQAAIQEIQRIWPTLRKNEIRIVIPTAVLPPPAALAPKPAAKPEQAKAAEPAAKEAPPTQPEPKPEAPKEAPAKPEQAKAAEPAPKEAPPAEAEGKPAEEPPEPSPDDAASDPSRVIFAFAAFELGSPAQADQGDPPPATADSPDQPAPKRAEQPVAGRAPGGKDAEQGPAPPPPPVYIVLGEGSVTIVSDDPEALDQFEQLLRTLLPSTSTIGRNISIFELKHSSAALVAETLEDLFRSSPFSFRRGTGSVVIVPDERLNTILVQGSRIDRETVQSLLRVLDSDKVPEALAGQKPNLIPIENVDAEQIAEVIRNVFKSQLTPPATSRGRSGQAARSGLPTPQVAVDEGTNSLVVMATSPLLDQIIELVQTLDQAAGDKPARRLRIIPLQKTDAGRVQKALEQILKTRSSRRSR